MRNKFANSFKILLTSCIILFFYDTTFGQTLADADQIANAHYITQIIFDSSVARRDSLKQGAASESEETIINWVIRGDKDMETNGVPAYSTQSFYLSHRLPIGYWWYISSNDSIVNYYDDLITINFIDFSTIDAPVVIMIFDNNDYLLASYSVFIDPNTHINLSPGTIKTGTQSILWGQSASNMRATNARGGSCISASEYQYQWQRSYDSTSYSDIIDANLDSLVVQSSLDLLFETNHKCVSFRRRVICNADTSYTGGVSILLVDSLNAGTISPLTQSVAINQIPVTIYGTSVFGGLCQGDYQYKWQFSDDNVAFCNLDDQITDSLHFNTTLVNSAYYRRAIFCNNDTAYSNSIVINVSGSSLALKPGVNTSLTAVNVVARNLPAVYDTVPSKYTRVYVPVIPIQDDSAINMNAAVEDVGIATVYYDSYGRTIQTVTRQTSPLKYDNVSAAVYDEFGRAPVNYLPFVSDSNNGNFKANPFYQDSVFYKQQFPNEKINYTQTIYDGSPFNIPLYQRAQGNSWGGSGRGPSFKYRANATYDSVRLWNIGINTEDDIPVTTGYYLPGTLSVSEVTSEENMTSVKYTDEIGRTILTKTLLESGLVLGDATWLCTYYVYDEMNHLRMVIPPKASETLKTNSWDLSSNNSINTNLCYAYFYDELGRPIMKRIPGKGKSYIAYDIMNRVVMSQDAHLRANSQWTFVLYDGQSRPVKSGVITTSLLKDSILAQAARSHDYPTLSGTYQITSENYYDDYSWVAASSAPVSETLDETNINSANFNTSYNTSPDYAQQQTKSLRIRGAVTGSKRLILNSTDYLYTVNFYDEKGRAIQTKQTNYTGGTDISTIQYSYSGKVLRTFLKHQKAGANAQTHTVLTKYSYDHVGRVMSVTKNLDSLGDNQISEASYNELGQVKQKIMGDQLETQDYSYNIRGWILGINKDYVKSSSSTSNYFGEMLSYDSGYTNTRFDGNISGIQWKAAGDRIARSYGFNYDNANRLTYADFYQQNTGSTDWKKDKVDYTVNNLSYDENGNILGMKQRGLMIGSSATIDSLTYQYFSNSNLLEKVSDGMTDNSPMGDFKDSTNTNDDYTYDVNGNITRDNNRHLHTAANGPGAVFNLLDKPDSMVIAGKSGTHYYYDASGVTLRKQINDYSDTVIKVKNYLYIGGFVYLNDTLQYALTEEGRIRWAQKRNSQNGELYYTYEYDYFIKDHQGNVRTVITEGKDTAFYQATMEPARQGTEDALFANVYTPANTVYDKPTGFDSDTANHKVSRLNATTGTNLKMGPSLVLKVMAGDKVQMNSFAFFNTAAEQPQSGVNLLSDILANLPGAVINNSVGKLATGNLTALSGTLSPNVTQFLNDNRPYDNTRPRAYLNWILFDEQFNFIATNSGVIQVLAGTEKQALVAPLQTMSKSGFLYIYVSNESPQNVYFDDITVQHFSGPLLQEQSYYPFGLQMAGISSKAALSSLSAYKYNAGSELEDEGGLNYYNTFYRKYDAQIGRFTGVDVMAESFAGITPFQFGNNNPVFFNDPLGDKFVQIKESAWSAPRQNNPHDYLTNDGWFDNIGNSWDREAQTGSGGGYSAEAFGFIAILNALNNGATINDNGDLGNGFAVDVFDINGNLLGEINGFYGIHVPATGLNNWGVVLTLAYTNTNPNGPTNLNWVQNVITNNLQQFGSCGPTPLNEYYIDRQPTTGSCAEPFYTSNAIMSQKIKNQEFNDIFEDGSQDFSEKSTTNFQDSPNRNLTDNRGNFYWKASVSLVTVNAGNQLGNTLITFSYGFNVTSGVFGTYNISIPFSNPPKH